MKYKNYLTRVHRCYQTDFVLARGKEVEGYSDLAIVRLSTSPLVFDGNFAIIDINSGLFICSDSKRSKCLEKFNYKLIHNNLERAIIEARKGEKYAQRCRELKDEIKVWRESGYEI